MLWIVTISQLTESEGVVATLSPTMATVVQMMHSLPENAQERVAEQLREFIADLCDELEWDERFAQSQDRLAAAARRAREQIEAGLARPFDPEQL